MSINARAFAIAQSEASRLALEPLHAVAWDEPTRSSPREQHTLCRRLVPARAVALYLPSGVTCPDCLSELRLNRRLA
jgi:hypothetical protein